MTQQILGMVTTLHKIIDFVNLYKFNSNASQMTPGFFNLGYGKIL